MIDKDKAVEAQKVAASLIIHHRHGIRKACEPLLTADQLRELFVKLEKYEDIINDYARNAVETAERLIELSEECDRYKADLANANTLLIETYRFLLENSHTFPAGFNLSDKIERSMKDSMESLLEPVSTPSEA